MWLWHFVPYVCSQVQQYKIECKCDQQRNKIDDLKRLSPHDPWINTNVISVLDQKLDVSLHVIQHLQSSHTNVNRTPVQWRHNWHDDVSNHQPHPCLLNRLFGRRSKKTSNLRVTGLCVGNSPGTGEFPTQMASNAENISIWWRHHEF